jgi:hypothetical protein
VHVYECHLSDGFAESLFDTAVYRFLEREAPTDSSVSVHTEVRSSGLVKSVQLWSTCAVADFERYWRSFANERVGCRPFAA